MALTINKSLKELKTFFKKEIYPGEDKLSYFDLLKKNLAEEGSWDDELISNTKKEIHSWLKKLNEDDLQSLWKHSESSEAVETDKVEQIVGELSEELLDLVLEQVEEVTPREEFFIDLNQKEADTDDEIDIELDDIFEEDELDDFDDDFYDDRY